MFFKTLFFLATVLCAVNGSIAQQNGQPHLYFFTNPGCGPCKQVEPEIQLLISKGYPVSIVDTNQRPDIAQQFNVDRTPTTILVADNSIAGRHAGLIDARTIVDWFDAANATQRQDSETRSVPARNASHSVQPAVESSEPSRSDLDASEISSTVHQGTRQPKGQAEFAAMQATVRLKVEDDAGISFASGTVIHCQNGECLVLTCGHVFRESSGKGVITADIGFETSTPQTFAGRLVSYNTGSKDVALVVVKTGFDLPAVRLAPATFPIASGDQVFALGCDRGQDATIRRTRIKRQAFYSSKETPNDKAKKYDIYGRPVDGRSGGGLFTAGGQLIGVCNAAAVEVDEGVYTSLENIYWQLAQVNLSHLFEPSQRIATAPRNDQDGSHGIRGQVVQPLRRGLDQPAITPVERFSPTPMSADDTQIIIVLQSKSAPGQAETLVIDRPSQELINQLRSEGRGSSRDSDRMAQLRREMPAVDAPQGSLQYRAQSQR